MNIFFFHFKPKSGVLCEIEKFARAKFPACIKQILRQSGYDTSMSLKAIDIASISKLEEYANENRHLINNLECCFSAVYKAQDIFKFLPGRKAIILDIPRQIKDMSEQKKKQKPGRKPKERSLDTLLMMLISQLSMYPSKVGFNLPNGIISERNIVFTEYEQQDDNAIVVHCGFSCPFCKKVTKITFKNYWWVSNAKKHLKTHIDEELARTAAQ